jgi:valyl-tRNA synthetase
MAVYTTFWQEFSSWYLEAVKPAYQQPLDTETYKATVEFFDKLLRLLHPFMPFITEEIWQILEERKEGESIMVSDMPVASETNNEIVEQFELTKEVVGNIRTIRKEKNLPAKEQLSLSVLPANGDYSTTFDAVMVKLANLKEVSKVSEKVEGALSFMVNTNDYLVPMDGLVDVEAEIKKLEQELKYQEGFLNSVTRKLSNERFVNNAPEAVVAKERQKQADAEAKIKTLKASIENLKK